MSDDWVDEIPASRVHIALEVDTAGASERKELPLRLLVLNDFSTEQKSMPLEERLPVTVTENSINDVMKKLRPGCDFYVVDHIGSSDGGRKDSVANEKMMKINMQFNSIADFRPEAIVKSVPKLRRLIALRNVLLDLSREL